MNPSSMSKVIVITGECDPKICKWFSERGASCMVQFPRPGVDIEEIKEFTSIPCNKCGVRPRLVTGPYYG